MTLPPQQKAIIITGKGGPEMLQQSDIPVPQPKAGQILIRIAAAGVNRHDCNQRAAGAHHDGTPVPGIEASGHVVALGPDVTHLALGTPVIALLQGGGYGEYALVQSDLAMPLPDGLTMTEAAGVAEALSTAWWNFFFLMDLRPGEISLIHGGTSGVGHLALQAMSALNYPVIATAGSDAKIAAAQEFGAMAALAIAPPQLPLRFQKATDGRGVNALLDVSAGDHIAADFAMMAPDGRIAHLYPGPAGAVLPVPLRLLMTKRLRVTGSMLRPLALSQKAQVADRLHQEVWPMLGSTVRPHIHMALPLHDAAQAHREMEKGRHIGKIILEVAI
jgi:putative PIG3 family NAD(P)H quinone oxidoreductase